MIVLNIENINLLFFCLLEASFKIHLAQKSLNGHDASDDQDNVSKCIDIVSNCHGAHSREKQEHADEDVNSNNGI